VLTLQVYLTSLWRTPFPRFSISAPFDSKSPALEQHFLRIVLLGADLGGERGLIRFPLVQKENQGRVFSSFYFCLPANRVSGLFSCVMEKGPQSKKKNCRWTSVEFFNGELHQPLRSLLSGRPWKIMKNSRDRTLTRSPDSKEIEFKIFCLRNSLNLAV